MINAIDVLRVLEVFKALKASSDIPDETKKLIAAELLSSVPPEIMAPGAKVTSDTIRNMIKGYINDGRSNGSAEAARKAPESPRKAEEAGLGTQEVPEIRQSLPAEIIEEVAGSGDRHRVEESPEGTLGRPGVAGEEARSHEGRKGARKAARRS